MAPARCCCDVRTRRWKGARRPEGAGESPSPQGDTRDLGRGKGPRGSVEPGHEDQESGGKQRGVGDAGDRGDRPEKQQQDEDAKEYNCKGCCHFQMLILISRMQSLVKILSDLCQILLQIET